MRRPPTFTARAPEVAAIAAPHVAHAESSPRELRARLPDAPVRGLSSAELAESSRSVAVSEARSPSGRMARDDIARIRRFSSVCVAVSGTVEAGGCRGERCFTPAPARIARRRAQRAPATPASPVMASAHESAPGSRLAPSRNHHEPNQGA